MDANRRDFFKITVAGGSRRSRFSAFRLGALLMLNFRSWKIALRAQETRSLCPYCAVGCGILIYTIGDNAKNVTPQVIHVEGDPDHPTNRGTLCPKGASLHQDILESTTAAEAAGLPSPDRIIGKDIGWGISGDG